MSYCTISGQCQDGVLVWSISAILKPRPIRAAMPLARFAAIYVLLAEYRLSEHA
jgi:hypothetical protein